MKGTYNRGLVFIISLMFIAIVFFPITTSMNNTTTAQFITTEDTTPPLVQIIKPINAIYIFDKEIVESELPIIVKMINIEVNAVDNESGINRVEFYVDGMFKEKDTSEPYTYYWDEFIAGLQWIEVIAYDNAENNASAEILVFKWRYPPITFLPLLLFFLLFGFIPFVW